MLINKRGNELQNKGYFYFQLRNTFIDQHLHLLNHLASRDTPVFELKCDSQN